MYRPMSPCDSIAMFLWSVNETRWISYKNRLAPPPLGNLQRSDCAEFCIKMTARQTGFAALFSLMLTCGGLLMLLLILIN